LKVRTVLVLLLILALVLPVSFSFYSTQFSGFAYPTGESTSSVVVVLKESYVLARVQVTVDPQVGVQVRLQNGTTVTLSPSASVRFENGTTRTLTSPETFSFILPNTVTFSLERAGTSGPGFSLDPSTPIAGGVLTGNDTQDIEGWQGLSGIDTFYFQVTGYAQISVTALGMSV
jgi:hypothetical protein